MKKVTLHMIFLGLFLISTYAQVYEPEFMVIDTLKLARFELKVDETSYIYMHPGQTRFTIYTNQNSTQSNLSKIENLKTTFNEHCTIGKEQGKPNTLINCQKKDFSLQIPLGVLFKKFEYHGATLQETYFRISLGLLYKRMLKSVCELNIRPMSETYFHKKGGSDTSFGLNFGFGLSNNFQVWTLRPEAGALFIGDFAWSMGVTGLFVLK